MLRESRPGAAAKVPLMGPCSFLLFSSILQAMESTEPRVCMNSASLRATRKVEKLPSKLNCTWGEPSMRLDEANDHVWGSCHARLVQKRHEPAHRRQELLGPAQRIGQACQVALFACQPYHAAVRLHPIGDRFFRLGVRGLGLAMRKSWARSLRLRQAGRRSVSVTLSIFRRDPGGAQGTLPSQASRTTPPQARSIYYKNRQNSIRYTMRI